MKSDEVVETIKYSPLFLCTFKHRTAISWFAVTIVPYPAPLSWTIYSINCSCLPILSSYLSQKFYTLFCMGRILRWYNLITDLRFSGTIFLNLLLSLQNLKYVHLHSFLVTHAKPPTFFTQFFSSKDSIPLWNNVW